MLEALKRLNDGNIRLGSESQPSLATFSNVKSAVKAMRPESPLYCLHPQALAHSARAFLVGFPGNIFYAVKSNPD